MLTPALGVLLVLFVGGVVVGVAQSFNYMPVIGLTEPSLRHYVALLGEREFWVSLGLTLYLAFAATTLATILAVVSAMVLRWVGQTSGRGAAWLTLIYQVPLPVPHLVAAAGIAMLLAQSGLVARLLYAVGGLTQPGEFPVLIFDRAHVGVLLVYVWKEVPFIGLVALAVLRGVGHEYEEVAQTLGASGLQRFRYVLLPLLLPGIVTTSIIVFAFLFGSFEVPLLLGQRYPSALPVLAYRAYSDPDLARRPEAMAIGVVITLIVMGLMTLYRRLTARVRLAVMRRDGAL